MTLTAWLLVQTALMPAVRNWYSRVGVDQLHVALESGATPITISYPITRPQSAVRRGGYCNVGGKWYRDVPHPPHTALPLMISRFSGPSAAPKN